MPKPYRPFVFNGTTFYRKPLVPRDPVEWRNQRALVAFEQGASAARKDKTPQACPYQPGQTDLWDAWHCGFNEEEPSYVITEKGMEARHG